MRKFSTFATLFLGLTIVFWTPTAKGDCPHGTKFDHPHYDGGDRTGDVTRTAACRQERKSPLPNCTTEVISRLPAKNLKPCESSPVAGLVLSSWFVVFPAIFGRQNNLVKRFSYLIPVFPVHGYSIIKKRFQIFTSAGEVVKIVAQSSKTHERLRE